MNQGSTTYTWEDSTTHTWKAYKYEVNFGVNVEFAVLFGVLAIYQVFLMIRQKNFGKNLPAGISNRFIGILSPFLVGLILECIGYIGRIINHYNNSSLDAYILQALFLFLIAPKVMAASIYMSVGEIVKVYDAEEYFLIPIKWSTKIFIMGDVLSILLQAAGGIVQATDTIHHFDIGSKVVIAGLLVQLIFFSIFTVTSCCFLIRYYPKTKPSWIKSGFTRDSWVVLLSSLIITSIFILIRSIYRVIEYLQGQNGNLLSLEMYLFILDSSMMFFGACSYLGIDITNNLSKVHYDKIHQEQFEVINVCTSITQQVEFNKYSCNQFRVL